MTAPAPTPPPSGERATVSSRRGSTFYVVDCLSCGWVEPDARNPHAAASRHATANPGHQVHLTMERVRVYEASR